MRLARLLRHLLHPDWLTRMAFPEPALHRIEAVVRASEARHAGELRFVVEGALDTLSLLRGVAARERALRVFSDLRMWDTEANNGVLIYLLLADHDVEIVADRGLNERVTADEWQALCHEMEALFRQRRFEAGVLLGIARVEALLCRHYPRSGSSRNDLPDRPMLL